MEVGVSRDEFRKSILQGTPYVLRLRVTTFVPLLRAVLTAEIVAYFFPRAVELHNYRYAVRAPCTAAARKLMDAFSSRSGAHSVKEKLYNWNTLNVKARWAAKANRGATSIPLKQTVCM